MTMKTFQLMNDWEFHANAAYAQPLHVTENDRVLRFTLRPGQSVKEHMAPHSPVNIVVLAGQGLFAGADGKEMLYGANSLLVFDAGENHSIRALKEELVFVAFLHGAPGYE
jgi:quercetin dioxygenase-like cupin family protein